MHGSIYSERKHEREGKWLKEGTIILHAAFLRLERFTLFHKFIFHFGHWFYLELTEFFQLLIIYLFFLCISEKISPNTCYNKHRLST